VEDLDGNLPVVLQVFGKKDRRHCADADLALDRVAVGEGELGMVLEVGRTASLCCRGVKDSP
jgi:hypothetical protein